MYRNLPSRYPYAPAAQIDRRPGSQREQWEGAIALLILATAMMLAMAAGGCAVLGARPAAGQDPFVVTAQASLRQAHAACQAFLQLDDDNRDFIRTALPEVHAFAEDLRRRDPETGEAQEIKINREAFDAVAAYAAATSTTNQDTARKKLQAVEDLAEKAIEFTVRISQTKTAAARAAS